MKKEDIEKQRGLKASINEGSANSFSIGISNSYITPFALRLGAKELHIGILSSIVGLLSPITQLYGSKLIDTHERKKTVLKSVLWQAILWLPLTIIALLKFFNIYENSLIYLLIIAYSLVISVSGLGHPSWFSWMGDLVSEKERGKYFAKKNVINGIVELIALVLGTFIIQTFENKNIAMIGFALIFFISFIFRYISYLFLQNQYIKKRKITQRFETSILDLIRGNKNYRNFAIYQLFFNITLMIASPFFAVYMLNNLHFNYTQYIIVAMSGSIFYLLFTPLAGKLSDKYGNVKLLFIGNILFAINPLLWLFLKSPVSLTLLPQLISGAANAAMIISFTNFSYDYLNEKERGIGIAYGNLSAGIGIFIGSLIGGFLLQYLKLSFISNFFFVFILAAILRAIVAIVYLPKIKEIKKFKRVPDLHVSITHPFKTIHSEISWVKRIVR